MKNRNILIDDHANRSQSMNLPFHYAASGCNVYMLKQGEFKESHDWSRMPMWTRLLFKPHPEATCRNLDDYVMKEEDVLFGEDHFLVSEREELIGSSYVGPAHVTLVTEKDLKTLGKDIDVYHTTEFCRDALPILLPWAAKTLPNAKWATSSVNPADAPKRCHVAPWNPENICISVPSPCENMFSDTSKNIFHMFRNSFELDLLNVRRDIKRNPMMVSSFMHNFHVRDPGYYELFMILQRELSSAGITLTNYGGNIRRVGADLRFSRGGPTGIGPSGSNFETLSPKRSCEKYLESIAVVHLKGLDWAGGVPAHAQMTGTPFITTSPYLNNSNYTKYHIKRPGTFICDTIPQMRDAIFRLITDNEFFNQASTGIQQLQDDFFTTDYWKKWHQFVECIR